MRWRRAFGPLGHLCRNGRLTEQLQGVQRGWGELWSAEATVKLAEGIRHRLVIVVRLVRPFGAAAKVAADGVLLLAPDFAQRNEGSLQGCGQGFWSLAVHG